jgi:hypothetical protein
MLGTSAFSARTEFSVTTGMFRVFLGRKPLNFSAVETGWRRERHSNRQCNLLSRKARRVRRLREICCSKHSPRLCPIRAVVLSFCYSLSADHAARKGVENHGQIEKLLAQANIGQIGYPH